MRILRNYGVFQFCYIVNFLITLFILLIGLFRLHNNWYVDDSSVMFFIICFIISSLYGALDWFSYKLLQSIQRQTFQSKKVKSRADTIKNLCLFITVLFSIGAVGLIIDTLFYNEFHSLSITSIITTFLFLLFIGTSFYLCISYSFLEKEYEADFTKRIDSFGEEEY